MSKIFIVATTSITINLFLRDHILNLLENNKCYIISNDTHKLDFNHKNLYSKNINFSRKINIFNDIKCFFQFLIYSIKSKPNLYLSITPKAGWLTSLVNTVTFSRKHIHFFTGQHWTNYSYFKKFLFRLIDQYILMKSIKSLVDGISQIKYLKSQLWICKNKLVVLKNGSIKGIDQNKFFVSKKYNESIKNKTNFDDNLKIILYVGRINYEKGVICLANAVLTLINSGEKIGLLLVGTKEDSSADEIEKIFSNNCNRLAICDHTNNTERYYNYSYITCLPSTREGFGMTLIESSACGTPVIGSNIYGLKDSFIDRKSGLSFELNNAKDLASKIKILLYDEEKYNYFKNFGIKRVKDDFDKYKIEQEFNRFISNYI